MASAPHTCNASEGTNEKRPSRAVGDHVLQTALLHSGVQGIRNGMKQSVLAPRFTFITPYGNLIICLLVIL